MCKSGDKNKHHLISRNFRLINILVPCLFISIFFYFMYHYSNALISSDDASELVLAKLLSEEHKVITRNWFYSSELRVFNTQLIFAPLFYVCSSWQMVRVVGSTVLLVILELSAVILGKGLALSWKQISALGCMLIVPLSYSYFRTVMFGSYYIPHIAISFVTIGLVFLALKASSGLKRYILLGLAAVLAFLAGMGGLRQIFILYLPMNLAALIMLYMVYGHQHHYVRFDIKSLLVISGGLLVVSGGGYILNSKYLSQRYHFMHWDSVKFTEFSPSSFIEAMNGTLHIFGYQSGNGLFSAALLQNGFCFIFLCLVFKEVFKIIRRFEESGEKIFLSLFFLISWVVLFGLYSFSDMSYSDRYSIPAMTFSFPIVMFYFNDFRSIPRWWSRFAISIFCIGFLGCGMMIYRASLQETKRSNELQSIASLITEEGFRTVYCTFWNGNVLTELSNGKIDARVWADAFYGLDAFNQLTDVNSTYQILQKVEHVSTMPDGKVSCIFNKLEENSFFAQKMDASHKIYASDNYTVYGFDSYNDLVSVVSR